MNKEICFISSPGNGLFCCCRQSEVRNPSPTWSGKWNEAADPNLNPMQAVETESIGNSRAGSTSVWRSAKGGRKEVEALAAPAMTSASHHRKRYTTHRAFTFACVGAAMANETWKFVQAKSKQAMKQVLGIRDEKTRMKVTLPLALAPVTQEDDMRWNPNDDGIVSNP